MRRAFLFIVLLVVVLAVVDHRRDHAHDDDTYLQQLERRIECATWESHHDSAYNYWVRYPSCFLPTESNGEGNASFVYVEELPFRNVLYMTIDITTQPCLDPQNPYHEIQLIAKEMSGICLQQSDSTYLISTKMESRDPEVTVYQMYAKYVLRQRLWFVETFIYPKDFAPAVQRIVHEVKDWQPFGN